MCSDLHFCITQSARRTPLTHFLSICYTRPNQWRLVCICLSACVLEARPGCNLTTLFGTLESVEIKAVPVTPTKKRGWLPLLTILFMISYGLMTMLIVEQGRTIESQRALIRDLFRDSTELSAVKMKALEEHSQAQNPSSQTPSTQAPSVQAPSIQAPMKQTPSSQAETQSRPQIRVKPNSQFQMPSKPAMDLQDNRRALKTI
jgi:hypothetical protein